MCTAEEESFMRLALRLARKGIGNVNPNPPVGAVIVDNGEVISTGYHKSYGENHAEREAILKALSLGKRLESATLYVTLEPCNHWGKTPPCTDLIIESGLKRVVVSTHDPNLSSNNGISKLRNTGIQVDVGLLEEEAKETMKFFIKSITTHIPYITLKYATTLDGKIADQSGNSKWITTELRPIVHKLRSQHMAILVGANTVLEDNPQLNVRFSKGHSRNPARVILDRNGRVFDGLNELNVFKNDAKVFVFTERSIESIEALPSHVQVFNASKPDSILKKLHEMQIDSVLIEGGAEMFSEFILYADEIYGFYGMKVLGKGRDVFANLERSIDSAFDFRISRVLVSKSRSEFLVVMKRCLQE